MSYVGYGQSPYVQEPKVRMDAIGEAWALVREKLGVWIPAGLIVGGVGYALSFGISFALQRVLVGTPTVNPSNPFSVFSPGYFISLGLSTLVSSVIGAFISSSLLKLALKQLRGENIQLSDAFQFSGTNIGAIILTNIVIGFLTFIGTLLCYIPGIIVAIGTMLALPLAVDRGIGGIDPVAQSWAKMSKGNLLNGFLLLLVLGLLVAVSAIPLGLGLLVTGPIAVVTIAIVYRDFFDSETTMRGTTLDVPLPPASAYGAGQYNAPDAGTGRYPAAPPPPPAPATPGQMGSLDI